MSDLKPQPPSDDWPPPDGDRVLDYRSAMSDRPKRLSGARFFSQAIGGIILGIFMFAMLIGATRSGWAAVSIPVGLGMGLCFIPRVRGVGLGLIIALPVGALIGLGICFMGGGIKING